MTKQEQIEEIAKEIFNSGIAIMASDLAYGLIDNDDNFHRLAKYLYAAGYRKIFTSDLTSDTQKAFKRGYEKGYDAGFKDGCNQERKKNYDRGFSDGQSISRKETEKEILQSGYVYDTTRGNKVNIIQMAREIERKETAMEILNRINEYYLDYNYDLKKEFEKLCKEYGVEVEE